MSTCKTEVLGSLLDVQEPLTDDLIRPHLGFESHPPPCAENVLMSAHAGTAAETVEPAKGQRSMNLAGDHSGATNASAESL